MKILMSGHLHEFNLARESSYESDTRRPFSLGDTHRAIPAGEASHFRSVLIVSVAELRHLFLLFKHWHMFTRLT